MVEKKSAKADLENKKGMFVQIGLIVALGLCLFGFEYKTYEKKEVNTYERAVIETAEEQVEITKQETPPPAAVPPPQVTVLNIVENDVEIENDIEINSEADETTEVQEYVPVQKAKEEEIVEAEVFTVVESMPDFPGGDAARMKFLQENIKYPQMARESNISGTVYVTFVVEPSGAVTGVRILRGIGGGCDEEAMRVIKAMPKWKAGQQRGKPVRVQFNRRRGGAAP